MHWYMMRKLLTLLALLLLATPAVAQEDVPTSPIATTQLLLHAPTVKSGEKIWAAVLFTLPKDWHIYWVNPGDSGMPTSLEWLLPEGMSAGEPQWPTPERIITAGIVNYGYSERVLLPVALTPARNGINGQVTVKANWLVCKDICIPESALLSAPLPQSSPQASLLISEALEHLPRFMESDAAFWVDGETVRLHARIGAADDDFSTLRDAVWFPVQDGVIQNSGRQTFTVNDGILTLDMPRGTGDIPEAWGGILEVITDEDSASFSLTARAQDHAAPTAPVLESSMAVVANDFSEPLVVVLLFAFLGGLILNAMPCVLPILSLKALALAKKSGAAQREARVQGFAYTAGVVASFIAIAGVMLALKSAGAAIGWGFQLQEPSVITALFLLMLMVSLNLFGLLEIPVLFGNVRNESDYPSSAFFTGALAVALATPCTAPFMAPVIGATLHLSAPITLMVFAMLGFGMAAPFLLISLWPAARRLLPKPGMWMLRFKQFLGFPMLATAAWLLWVLSQINGATGLMLALTGAVIAAWLVWWAHVTGSYSRRKCLLLAVLAVCAWCVWAQPAPSVSDAPSRGEAFSAERLASLRGEGRGVFVDVTAAWCITCKINERAALGDDDVERLFAEKNIALLVADWTTRDAAITSYLAQFGRNGVPLYVYYPPMGEPKILPQILTPSSVREAIAE